MVLGIVVLSPFLWVLDLYHYLWQSKSFQIYRLDSLHVGRLAFKCHQNIWICPR